jgi:DNA repair exonuclease SbcCD ATPase subunit
MDPNGTKENYAAIELAIKRLTDEITKLSDESNSVLESAVFVGMSREQEQRREQRLKEMHSLLERLQRKQEELERVKQQCRAAGSQG